MHMIHRSAFICAGILALAGCNSAEQGSDVTDAEAAIDETVSDDAPDLFADAGTGQDADEGAASMPSCPDNAFCEGPIVVRPDTVNLVPQYDTRVQLSGTYSIENRSDSDLRVVLMQNYITASLENGVNGQQSAQNASGLELCRGSGADCFASEPSSFRSLSPGDSPAKVTVSVPLNFEAQMMPSVRDASTGSVDFQVYSVSASGEQRLHQVSLSNFPFRNQLAD